METFKLIGYFSLELLSQVFSALYECFTSFLPFKFIVILLVMIVAIIAVFRVISD